MADGAVLLLVNERGDRRLLWELLDGEEFEALYAAKDVAQARSMLAQDSEVALVVLEVGAEDSEVKLFCEELMQDPQTSALPVLIVSSVDPGHVWTHAVPANVRGFLHSPVESEAALALIQSAIMPAAPVAASAAVDTAHVASSGEDYRFAFDASLDELLVSDPTSGKVLDANQTFLKQSGFTLDQVRARPSTSST
ncbi:MAG: hypothetical protein IPO95_02655 [Rhodanobacteraceae bacterium]|nr:hypothetical protein [Rhodanobacteraceae bacterium]